jgi:multiple sugar transport system permease protein
VTIPYQGYEAKYLAAFMSKGSAPDIFMGMTHQWCGQYDFCDRMPADLEKLYDQNLPKYMADIGKWNGARYGIPIEHGNFQQMYINADMFRKAGLNPDDPPKTFTGDWLAAMKKLTISDPKGGDPTQVGFAIRSKGAPVGITDKFLPFAHAWGAPHAEPNLDKATGYANSPEMVAALTFFGDLVNKDKVASLSFGNPEDAFGQKRAAVIFRESWFFGWLKKNAPDVNFKVYALPCEKVCPGAGALFPWTDLVYKNSPNKQVAWEFMRFISNAKDDMEHHQLQGILPVWTANLETDYVKSRPDYKSTKDMLAQQVPPTYFHPKSNELATRVRRSGGRRSVRQGTTQAAARRGRGEDGSHTQGLSTRRGATRTVRRWYRLAFPRNHLERRKRAGFLFVLPALLFFGAVFVLPLAQSVTYSFYKIAPGGAREFVGLRLYEKVLTDPTFWRAVWNTVQLLLMSVPITVVAALAVALGLNRIASLRWRNLWASMYFLPFATSLVAAALIWQWIYEPVYGFLNYALSFVGIPPQKWLQSLFEVRPAIAAVSVWVRIGFDTMIFLAALQSIPQEYYEAADMDGASPMQRLRYVTLPLLNAQIIMVCILELIFNFKMFDQVYATTQGGPRVRARP